MKEKDYFLKYKDQTFLDQWYNYSPIVGKGEPLCLQDNGVNVESFSGWGLPTPDTSLVKSAYVDGEFMASHKMGTRDMTMNIFTDGCSRADYWAMRKTLVEYLYNYSYPDSSLSNWAVPERWSSYAGDTTGVWETKLYYETLYSRDIPRTYPSAPTAYEYANGNLGPLMWIKDINDRTYHAYVHYQSGADFSPRDLEEWKEWSIEESLSFAAYDPYVYLHEPRVIDYSYTVPELKLSFDYYGNARAKPIVEFQNFARFLVEPGDWVEFEIGTWDLSDRADLESRVAGEEKIVLRITYEDIQRYYVQPVMDKNLKLIVNFTRRGMGVYLAGRETTTGTPYPAPVGAWSLWRAQWAIKIDPTSHINSVRNFSLFGIGPSTGEAVQSEPASLPFCSYFSGYKSCRFEWFETAAPASTVYLRASRFCATNTSAPAISGAMTFYETYGGV